MSLSFDCVITVRRRFLATTAALSAAGLLVACGGSNGSAGNAVSGDRSADGSPLEHIHGLAVNPSDDALIIATHNGLFRAAKGQQRAQRYGDSQQDVMGFSILGPDRFIGSGHPDPNDSSQPPNLGLIRSADAGRTWKAISLSGEADFHVLESSGERVYGYDGAPSRLMVSSDAGATWQQRAAPAPMFDLAINPRDPDRAIAATERGLFITKDAGERWQPTSVRTQLIGLLAWPRRDRLYVIDANGAVQVSADAGRQWKAAGSIGGQPAAFTAEGGELLAALPDGTVKHSTDAGQTWQVRAAP